MIRAAGILYQAQQDGGPVLFLQRSAEGDAPGYWCLPGGKIEDGESPEDAAVRESAEEIGSAPDGKRILLSRTIKPGLPSSLMIAGAPTEAAAPMPEEEAQLEAVDYTTFLQKVPEPFDVLLANGEHTAFTWAPVASPPQPLHPGVQTTLARMAADELGVARMMAAGELTSPQFYENVALFDIRITGTNVAYRSACEEFVYRDPANYLTEDFLARCNGLPVLWDHPRGSLLTSEEFGDRVVGTTFVPYIKGDDVWAIVKIYDDAAINAMVKGGMSTSPAVNFSTATVFRDASEGNQKVTMEDGSTLLIEGKPSLLDHIAVCDKGVWDKGGPAAGVNTAKADSEMDKDEKAKADAAAKADAVAKADAARRDAEEDRWKRLDAFMDSMGKRMDSMEDERKADKARRDSEESKKANEAANEPGAGDPEEVERKGKADAAKKDAAKSDSKKDEDKDEEDRKKADAAKKDEDEEDRKKADAARADSERRTVDMQHEIEQLKRRLDLRTVSDEDHRALADAQARADSVFAAFGQRAPRPMDGEKPLAYRRRMALGLKEHSPTWKGVEIDRAFADSSAFGVAETQIYADAMVTAKTPTNIPGGDLRAHTHTDQTGRTITDFYGEPASWMADFSAPRQRVVRFNNNAH